MQMSRRDSFARILLFAPCMSVVACFAAGSPQARADVAFLRGDAVQDGRLEITDPIGTLGYLFLGAATPACLDAADANDDGALNLTDAVFSLNFLFSGGAAFPAPYPECGPDPTSDQLGCSAASPPSCIATPTAIAARSLSMHYVLVTFDGPVTDDLLDAARYRIRRGDGSVLEVLEALRDPDDERSVILVTAPQDDSELELAQGGGAATNSPIVFQGSDDAEPRVVSAISLGSTPVQGQVLLTFSEPIDEGATDIRFYQISDPDLEVRSAAFSTVGQPGTTIVLTTDPQRNQLYTVKVTNIKSRAGDFLVDPTRNLVTFDGIPPVDTTPPRILSAAPSSNTQIILSFSEPLWPGADDPRNFVIGCFDPFRGATCPNLEITSAQLAMLGTQIVLTTLPQDPAFEYTVQVLNRCGSLPERDNCVQDLQENPIDPTGNTASFVGVDRDRPFLASAISLGPDPADPATRARVLLRFSEPVLDGAEDVANYSVVDPDLDLISAALGDDGLTVVLTTEAQQNKSYLVKVTNVRSRAAGYFIDPTRNTASFTGIPPVDTAGPRVLSADSTGVTGVLVSYDEPLLPGADDPLNYSISCQTLGGAPCADLVVTAAELTSFNTQVLLTTAPQTAFVEYTVTVGDRCAISQDNCVQDLQENPIDSTASSATFIFGGVPDYTDEAPRVVGAISTGNTTVVIQFSRPMSDSVLALTNYFIVQQNLNPEVGALPLVTRCVGGPNDGTICAGDADCNGGLCEGPRFLGANRLSVELKTLSQNEVTYAITAINVTDVNGSPIREPILTPGGIIVDPRTALFPGSPPSGGSFADTDGDGITDNVEQRGWVVAVQLTDGRTVERQVTSDPFNVDTDGDELDDLTELSLTSDPRQADTDGDTIPDAQEYNEIYSDQNDQDSDDDGVADNLEVDFFRTNAIIADSDGDGFQDDEELFELHRDPRVADLPEPLIDVSQIVLRLDERFTYTDESGETQASESSSSTTFERSSGTTLSRGSESITSGGFSIGVTGGVDGSGVDGGGAPRWGGITILGNVEGHAEFTSSFQVSSESAQASVSTFERSLSKGSEIARSRAVTREIVGASLQAFVNLDNPGGVAFTLKNLEITVAAPDARDRRSLVPIATLIANTTLITGEPAVYNIGAFQAARGPFLFASEQAYPNLVERLMRDPTGLVLKIANYELEDEFGRNFAYKSQVARDRTVGVVIDSGDGQVDRYFVSAAPRRDDNGDVVGGYGDFAGIGPRPSVTLASVLEEVLLLERSTVAVPAAWSGLPAVDSRDPDAIRAGKNGVSESFASGDDLQLVPAGIDGLTEDVVIIVAGENGVLDSVAAGDDVESVATGFSTASTCDADTDISIKAGPNGVVETRRVEGGDDLQARPFGSTGVAPSADVILPGANGFVDTAANGDDVYVGPGIPCDDDTDCPGGACDGQEILYRFEDRERGQFDRFWTVLIEDENQLGADFDELVLRPGEIVTLGFIQDRDRDGLISTQEFLFGSSDRRQDTDGDQIDDFAEAKVGWEIQVAGSPIRRVFSDPRLADSDLDGLSDHEEQDVRRVQCECVDDTDSTQRSGPCTPNADGTSPCPTGESCKNVADLDQGAGSLIDCSADVALQRTDPRSSDTDADLVRDGEEVLGFLTGAAIVDPREVIIAFTDRDADTEACPDDVCVGGGVNDGQRCRVNRDCGPRKECVGGGSVDGSPCTSDLDCSVDPSEPGICEVVRECVGGPSDGDRCVTNDDCGGGVCEEVGREGIECAHPAAAGEDACDDVQVVAVGTTGLGERTVVVAPGHDGVLHSTTVAGLTSGDRRITDSTASSNRDRIASTEARGDDEQIAAVGLSLASTDTFLGRTIVRPGFDGLFASTPKGDDVLALGQRLQTSDPLEPDTDGDLLTDGIERILGADPRNPADGRTPSDSDGDGLLDSVEESTGWLVAVNGGAATRVYSNSRTPDTDLDGLPDLAERLLGLDPTKVDTDSDGLPDFDELSEDQFTELSRFNGVFAGFFIDGSTSELVGSDPLDCDTDEDKLPDGFEALVGWSVRLTGVAGAEARQVFSDPLLADTDFDGLSDAAEYRHGSSSTLPTDPRNPDTDGDDRLDGTECATVLTPTVAACSVPSASQIFASCSQDPLVNDYRVTVSYATIVVRQGPEDGTNGKIDLSWRLRVQKPTDSYPGSFLMETSATTCAEGEISDCGECLVNEGLDMPLYRGSNSTTFSVVKSQGFLVHGEVNESDDCPKKTCQGGGDDGAECSSSSDCAGGALCAADITFQCHLTFFRSYSFEQLTPGFTTEVVSVTDTTGDAECSFDVVYEIRVE